MFRSFQPKKTVKFAAGLLQLCRF